MKHQGYNLVNSSVEALKNDRRLQSFDGQICVLPHIWNKR